MEFEYQKQLNETQIINLTILECKYINLYIFLSKFLNNKSNHIGM